MAFRYATPLVLGVLLVIIWAGQPPYLHDFGEWVYQSRILLLNWTQPEKVAGFQWAHYPVPNTLAITIMAVSGLFFSTITAAKLFLSLLLTGWYLVLRRFVLQFGNTAESMKLLFLLFSLIGLSNFFWTGFVNYQLALLLLVFFLTRFNLQISTLELATFAVLIFLSHAMVFLVFTLLVLLETLHRRGRLRWVLALLPAGILALWFLVGRSLGGFSSPLADAAMAGWKEAIIYKLGYPLILGPFKNLLQPDLSSLIDNSPWLYWTGFLANVLVVSGIGIFILMVLLWRTKGVTDRVPSDNWSQQTLQIAAWFLMLFYLFAPYNFFGLINPSGRVTIPLLLICLLQINGTPLVAHLARINKVLAPVTLVFTFFTVFTYLVLMQRAGAPEYLANVPTQTNKPPGDSVLDYNAWIYSQASYKYFNYRIFGFSHRFNDVELERFRSLGFRTAFLVDYKRSK